MFPKKELFSVLVVILSFGSQSVSARLINITYMGNCQDMGGEVPTVFVTDVDYHISEVDGTCDKVHTTMKITTNDPSPLVLTLTLYKCEASKMNGPCLNNPSDHEEYLTCERLKNDDSGPWHMFTSAMPKGYECGDKEGEFKLEFARLRLEHLIKYLDVYDSNMNTFRLKMLVRNSGTNILRGCGELDFALLAM